MLELCKINEQNIKKNTQAECTYNIIGTNLHWHWHWHKGRKTNISTKYLRTCSNLYHLPLSLDSFIFQKTGSVTHKTSVVKKSRK